MTEPTVKTDQINPKRFLIYSEQTLPESYLASLKVRELREIVRHGYS